MDSRDKWNQTNLDLRNVQSWPNQLDASTTHNSIGPPKRTKIVLDAIKGHKTLAQLSSEFGVHATQITSWKQQALEGLPTLFNGQANAGLSTQEREEIEAPLFQQIGQRKGENDYLKKNYGRASRWQTPIDGAWSWTVEY